MNVNPIVVVLFFCACIFFVISIRRHKHISSRAIHLLRALFPSWRFFDKLGHTPMLYVRADVSDDLDEQPWVPCLESTTRPWSTLLLNARGNLLYAYHSLIDHFVEDLERQPHPEAVSRLVSYKLICNLAEKTVRQKYGHIPSLKSFQFKLSITPTGMTAAEAQDILISPPQEITSC